MGIRAETDEADETWSNVADYCFLEALARRAPQFQSVTRGILGNWLAGSDWRSEWTQGHTGANSRLRQLLSVCSLEPQAELLPSSLSENRNMSLPCSEEGKRGHSFQVVPLGAGKRGPIPTKGTEIP